MSDLELLGITPLEIVVACLKPALFHSPQLDGCFMLQHVQCDVLQQPHSILANISQTVGMDEAESSAGSAALIKHHTPSLQLLEHRNLKLFKAM